MTEKRPPGRPKGKRSNPNYVPVSGYVSKESYRKLKIRCYELDMEISEALQIMIDRWLEES